MSLPRHVLVALLFLTFVVSASVVHDRVFAQNASLTILGSIVDERLAPVANATITIERDGRTVATTTSAADGTFRFTNLAPGTYRVRATAPNLPDFARDLTLAASAATVRLPITLARPLPAAEKVADTTAGSRSAISQPPGGGGGPAAAPPPPSAPPPTPPPSVSVTAQAVPAAGGRGGAARTSVNELQIAASDFREEREGGAPNYAHVPPNRFHYTREDPLSTFGADVDTASYANVRRFLSEGRLPPPDAVRIEELVNYFRFDYPAPRAGRPLSLTAEMADCPWAPAHNLVLIGARAAATDVREIRGRNIVLLVDVSGSMSPPERLPLLKSAFAMFVDTLRPDDRLAIVTYAGYSGVVLPSTSVRERDVIQRAIAGLGASGSTNGAQGLVTAYRVARDNYMPGGVNRVILATDGDFNVGVVNRNDLLRLIEREKASGVFLSVLGVGTDNLKDATMEMLADKGNGNYAYLDSLREARRVLIHEGDSTLETVAKDVKFQVEFNPAFVSAWKLIGYENRTLAAEDFNDDRKDGGELGSGHTVTMLYEIVPAGAGIDDGIPGGRPAVDPLKYQQEPRREPAIPATRTTTRNDEWLTVKARYKAPDGDVSDVIAAVVRAGGRVTFLPFAAAVAEYGLLLRDGSRNQTRWQTLADRVKTMLVPSALAPDKQDFSDLVDLARRLADSSTPRRW